MMIRYWSRENDINTVFDQEMSPFREQSFEKIKTTNLAESEAESLEADHKQLTQSWKYQFKLYGKSSEKFSHFYRYYYFDDLNQEEMKDRRMRRRLIFQNPDIYTG